MYNEFLSKEIALTTEALNNIDSAPVENIKSGGLLTDLKINKRGRIIPSNTEWNYFDISDISYISDNVFSIKDGDLFDYLQIGDKILARQSSTDKYFYIIYKNS